MEPTLPTPDRILHEATRQFADRGYTGTSLASIAASLNLTKQALLHHFGSKAHLHASVLARVSDRLIHAITDPTNATPVQRLTTCCDRLSAQALTHPADIQLLMQPPADNNAGTMPADPVLRHLMTLVQALPKWRAMPEPQALAIACQLLGAVVVLAQTTDAARAIVGDAQIAELRDIWPGELRRTLAQILGNG